MSLRRVPRGRFLPPAPEPPPGLATLLPLAVTRVQGSTPKGLGAAKEPLDSIGCTSVNVFETYTYKWSQTWGLENRRNNI